MKLRNLFLSLLAGSTLFITSCEECDHEGNQSIASSLQVGDVVCSDGSVLSKEKFSSSQKEPVAIVYHVNRNPEIKALGYAVSIRDRQPLPTVWVSNRKRQLHWKRKTVTRTPMPCTATRK